jgi:putative transposase
MHRRERRKPNALNEIWSLDFVADQLVDGRRFHVLTVVDLFTRESLAIEIGQSLKGEDVVGALNRIRLDRGVPKTLFCDNGAECLDAHWFATLSEAKQVIEVWRREYNESRSHRALGERTPNEFGGQVGACPELTTV